MTSPELNERYEIYLTPINTVKIRAVPKKRLKSLTEFTPIESDNDDDDAHSDHMAQLSSCSDW